MTIGGDSPNKYALNSNDDLENTSLIRGDDGEYDGTRGV
jgi:hypothetical protein